MRPKLNHLQKIRVGAVSYLNTRPLLHGIRNSSIFSGMDLTEDYPAHIAQMLIEGEIDIGLVPVAVIPKMKEWHIVGDYCIGADGPVASVCIFSECPMEEIEAVYLDYQSRTSVRLAKILLRDYWKKAVRLIDATGEDYRDQIKGTTAGVVIGDRALVQRSVSHYIYDLGAAWKDHTGLPFVFAAWISNRKLPAEFVQEFNKANAAGLMAIDAVVAQTPYAAFDLKEYFTRFISYELTEKKRRGLRLFLERIQTLPA